MQHFMNKEQLAKSLGMSKATLYKRSKELEIPISELDNLSYEQKNHLMSFRKNKSNRLINDKSFKQFNDKLNDKKIENKPFETENIYKELLIDQLKKKDEQISKLQKQNDQSQQLQLDLQQKLTQNNSEFEQLKLENKMMQEELTKVKTKSFWQKLFHK